MSTIKVGKAMLLQRWDDAVAAAMSSHGAAPGSAEREAKRQFEAAWAEALKLSGAERDAQSRAAAAEALKVLPRQCVAECELLGGLSRGLRPQVGTAPLRVRR